MFKLFKRRDDMRDEWICPHCGEELTEEEAEDTSDCGCPACRKLIDWEEE